MQKFARHNTLPVIWDDNSIIHMTSFNYLFSFVKGMQCKIYFNIESIYLYPRISISLSSSAQTFLQVLQMFLVHFAIT